MIAQNRDRKGQAVRAALYCRVSTAVGQNPEMQLRELKEFAERRGWKIAGEYLGSSVSWAKVSLPKIWLRRRFHTIWKSPRHLLLRQKGHPLRLSFAKYSGKMA